MRYLPLIFLAFPSILLAQGQQLKKRDQLDSIIHDPGNGDMVYQGRLAKTAKWGMFQNKTVLIPAEYDSLEFFAFNGSFTLVYQGDKVGVHTAYWTYEEEAAETVPCIYEAAKIYRYKGVRYLAVQKDGYWAWIDWRTADLKSDFTCKDPKELGVPPWIQRGFE